MMMMVLVMLFIAVAVAFMTVVAAHVGTSSIDSVQSGATPVGGRGDDGRKAASSNRV